MYSVYMGLYCGQFYKDSKYKGFSLCFFFLRYSEDNAWLGGLLANNDRARSLGSLFWEKPRSEGVIRFNAPFHILELGVPCGKWQGGEFVYLLWNVPIYIFAICYIISEVYKRFRYRKEWHSTLEKQTWVHSRLSLLLKNSKEALLSLLVNWCKLALIFYGNSKL